MIYLSYYIKIYMISSLNFFFMIYIFLDCPVKKNSLNFKFINIRTSFLFTLAFFVSWLMPIEYCQSIPGCKSALCNVRAMLCGHETFCYSRSISLPSDSSGGHLLRDLFFVYRGRPASMPQHALEGPLNLFS